MKTAEYKLSCASEERGIWLNLQTACLLMLCIAAILSAAAIIAVTVVCDASLHITFINGTLACGRAADLHETDPESSRFKLSGKVDTDKQGQNHTLGSAMRIILILLVVVIIVIVTFISMHKVIVRERHRNLSGQLTKLMNQNNVNSNTGIGASQVIMQVDDVEAEMV